VTADDSLVLEDSPAGRWLVVTGPWTAEAAEALRRGEADGLVLNYARGFTGAGLDFLAPDLPIRRLDVLDRSVSDLAPIERLAGSLESLSVQAAPSAELDLGALPRLREVAGEWELLRGTLGAVEALESVVTWEFDEVDLHAFRDHVELRELTIKDAPHVESLSGIGGLPDLWVLGIVLAPRLQDTSDVAELAESLRELKFDACPGITALDDLEPLVHLRVLGISDCGDIESLAPVRSLKQLGVLYAWGSTRVVDGDLSPLAALPRLKEVRMRDRRNYRPRVAEVAAALASRA
jgi:hypothetical protein